MGVVSCLLKIAIVTYLVFWTLLVVRVTQTVELECREDTFSKFHYLE